MPSCVWTRARRSTGRSRAMASAAVDRDPPLTWDSTTTTSSARPAMRRLRAGNRHRRGDAPSGASLHTTPVSRTRRHKRPIPRRVGTIDAGAHHPDRWRRRPLASAPAWAAASMPAARPDTTDTPGAGEHATQLVRDVDAIAGAVAGTDDRRGASRERRLGRPP